MVFRLLTVLTGILMVAGCSSKAPDFTVATSPPNASGSGSGPGSGQLHEVPAHSCRFAGTSFVQNAVGMRLGRVTRLRGRAVTGCRFYALQHSSLSASEHLPGPKQPVLEIVIRRLPTAVEARHAVVFLARANASAHRAHFGRTVGACFQTAFYPKDHGKDWACAADLHRTEVVVRSVDTTGAFSTTAVMRSVLRGV